MGWVKDKLSDGNQSNASEDTSAAAEQSFENSAERVWAQLAAGFEADVNEINVRDDADYRELSDHECRISSELTKIAVIVTADLTAHTIKYVYEPNETQIAVPEDGVLTLRPSGSGIELYSADQHLTSAQARRLILEPLFFANPPLKATGT